MSRTFLPLAVVLLTVPVVAQKADQQAHPALLSKVPSVQIELAGETPTEYRLALHNISSRTITAIRIERPYTGGKRSAEPSSGTRPAIAPRATLEMGFPSDKDPGPLKLIVTAAWFDDGTYEGDPASAAAIMARRDGIRVQHARIAEIVDGIAAKSALVDTEKIARMRAEVAQLSDVPDAATLDRLKVRFPELAADEWPVVADEMRGGMNGEKQGFAQNLDNFQAQAKSSPGTPSLSEWWRRLRKMADF